MNNLIDLIVEELHLKIEMDHHPLFEYFIVKFDYHELLDLIFVPIESQI
jgi:hypothetical protein